MASYQDNINSVINNTLLAYESICRADGLAILDAMHRDGILDHEQFFKYREIFDNMYRKGVDKL